MRLFGKMIASVVTTALGCALIQAQTAPSGSATPTRANRPTQSDTLRLNVFLSGTGAEDMQTSDLTLLDNGQPVTVQSLLPSRSDQAMTHVILVIDDVNARFSTVAYERSQLQKFFSRREGHLQFPLAVAVMTDTKMEIQPGFSQDGNEINRSLQKYEIGLHEIRRDSQWGFADRTNISLHRLEELVQYAGTVPGHKLILFVSPGWPLLSGPRAYLTGNQQKSIFASVARLQDSMLVNNVTLDMLNPLGTGESLLRSDYYQGFLKGVRKPSETDIADLSLQVLATHNGGLVQQGYNDIDAMVEKATTELGHMYTLTFLPSSSAATGGYHSLTARVNRAGLIVRTADEYYTTQAPPGQK